MTSETAVNEMVEVTIRFSYRLPEAGRRSKEYDGLTDAAECAQFDLDNTLPEELLTLSEGTVDTSFRVVSEEN